MIEKGNAKENIQEAGEKTNCNVVFSPLLTGVML